MVFTYWALVVKSDTVMVSDSTKFGLSITNFFPTLGPLMERFDLAVAR